MPGAGPGARIPNKGSVPGPEDGSWCPGLVSLQLSVWVEKGGVPQDWTWARGGSLPGLPPRRLSPLLSPRGRPAPGDMGPLSGQTSIARAQPRFLGCRLVWLLAGWKYRLAAPVARELRQMGCGDLLLGPDARSLLVAPSHGLSLRVGRTV